MYRVIGQDYAYRKGNLNSLVSNIAFHTNKDRSNLGLSLEIGTMDSLDHEGKLEPPSFAYIQTDLPPFVTPRLNEVDSCAAWGRF